MRLGIRSSKEYQRFGEEKYQKIKEHGYSAVDYQLADTTISPYNLSWEDAERFLIEERRRIEEAGLTVHQTHGPWRYPWQDATEEDRLERMEKMKLSIRFSALLGCENWVIHPLIPYGIEDKNTPFEMKTREINLIFFRELLEFAKGYGITICMENLPFPKFSLASPQDILQFVEEIDDLGFQICFDTGHAAVFLAGQIGDAIRLLGNSIRVFHVHDTKDQRDLHLMPYCGIIDWKDVGNAVRKIDFDGVFSLETAPNPNLPGELFEEMCRMQAKIAKSIVSEKANGES